MKVDGFKAFNEDHTNRSGKLFEEGKVYSTSGNIIPGQYNFKLQNGYHLSVDLSNVFKYFDESKGISIAKVTGFGKLRYFEAPPFMNYDYDNMYACEHIRINKFLKRNERMQELLSLPVSGICKYLISGSPSNEELRLIYDTYQDSNEVERIMLYFQLGVKDSFERKIDRQKVLSLLSNR